eukprot:COSAG06_NODE_266_length_18831_cov_301.960015_5_plen_261_part_00
MQENIEQFDAAAALYTIVLQQLSASIQNAATMSAAGDPDSISQNAAHVLDHAVNMGKDLVVVALREGSFHSTVSKVSGALRVMWNDAILLKLHPDDARKISNPFARVEHIMTSVEVLFLLQKVLSNLSTNSLGELDELGCSTLAHIKTEVAEVQAGAHKLLEQLRYAFPHTFATACTITAFRRTPGTCFALCFAVNCDIKVTTNNDTFALDRVHGRLPSSNARCSHRWVAISHGCGGGRCRVGAKASALASLPLHQKSGG